MKTAIIIPARYGSTRFPGKPLAKIGGKTMLERVVDIGRKASQGKDITLAVATEDDRIADHCKDIGVECIMTSDHCATGSDRVLEAANKLEDFDVIIGLQGDAPFTPPEAIEHIIMAFEKNPNAQVVTPVINLRWEELDSLRKAKETTPFSGTTCIRSDDGRAIWFSKNIIPAIRKENRGDEFSPVYQHLGIYGFCKDVLEDFVSWPQGRYEVLEGLEQLRLLENGVNVQTVVIDVDAGLAQAGIDSPEDLERAEKILAKQDAA